MKFGKVLASHDPEWQPHCINYKRLKKLLKNILDAAQGNRDVLEAERAFEEYLTAEIDKVSSFIREQDQELRNRLASFQSKAQTLVDADARRYAATDASEISRWLVRIEQFARLNGTAIHKILKKHDKNYGSAPLLPLFKDIHLLYSPQYGAVLGALNDVFVQLRGADTTGKEAAGGAPSVAAAGTGAAVAPAVVVAKPPEEAQNFERFTRKYWVRSDRVLELKAKILPHLQLASIYGDADTGGLVSSVYFDGPNMELYHDRLRRDEGAIALRMRWYGDGRAKEIFVERKTHHESWVLETSVKSRFSIKEERVLAFCKGEYTLDKRVAKLRQEAAEQTDPIRKKKLEAAVEELAELSSEVQHAIITRKLSPIIRTQYRRVAFQVPGNANVRISLDTDMCLLMERGKPPVQGEYGTNWHRGYRPAQEFPANECIRFPYAILEVKLQGASPDWAEKIINSDLVCEVHKFSKFMHSVAALYNDQVEILPWWWGVVGSEVAEESLPFSSTTKMLKAATDDAEKGGKKHDILPLPGSKPSTSQDASENGMQGKEKKKKAESEDNYGSLSSTSRVVPDQTSLSVSIHPVRAIDEERVPLLAGDRSLSGAGRPPLSWKDWGLNAVNRVKTAAVSGYRSLFSKAPKEKQTFASRRIQAPIKIEPKTFFANERTFMNWLGFSVVLMTLGVALISLKHAGGASSSPYRPDYNWTPMHKAAISGFAFLAAAIVVVFYAIGMYHYRTHNIRKKVAMSYADKIGPNFLVALLVALAGVNIYLYCAQFEPPCVDFGSYTGGKEFAPSGLIQHPLKQNSLLVVGASLAELQMDTLRVRSFSLKDSVDLTTIDLSGKVYLLKKWPPSIVEFDTTPKVEAITRSWLVPLSKPPQVTTWGVSSIAFIPDPSHPQGGQFILGTTGDGTLHLVDVPLKTEPATNDEPVVANVTGSVVLSAGMADVSGLKFESHSKQLYAMLDSSLVSISPSTFEIQREWPMLFRKW
eukprot:CAMPEP_0184671336 /NCGR_PEP_ID=MMETSP0308-20130426/85437_1 /TAXON_ID=38269 /ORGANISM="Gloeochaete witrockiana, Strain SAG 46.84" /LENGTH=985 /DNA_ID=CAMNT_0027118437 /DNA_START=121 /DNA_END=3075 /DNA_ORIENTATION=+